MMSRKGALGWIAIFRLGLVQAALGSIIVLTTSTLNRIMVVELGLDGTVDGASLEAGVALAETYSSRHCGCYEGQSDRLGCA